MTKPLIRLLTDEERHTLHEQTLTVLEEVGVAYNTPAAMDALEGTGAVLDHERLTARLPRDLVMRCLGTAPRQLLLAARDPAHDVWLGDGSLSFYRRRLRARGIRPQIARRGTQHGSGLGRERWVVERSFAWLHQFRRLLVRYERRADMHEAFLALGCCVICFPRLRAALRNEL